MVGDRQSGDGGSSFPRLFSPIQVGPMRVANRICATTTTMLLGRADGMPDDPFIAHHLAKAKGGAAWIGNETWFLSVPSPADAEPGTRVKPSALKFPLYTMPQFPERLARFTDLLHDADAVAVCQLTHMPLARGASSVADTEISDHVPHELDDDELSAIIQSYSEAAESFRAGNADGIEIHCAHESLPHMFLSPATNHRKDKWGGDVHGRTRLVVAILESIRERIGSSMAVGIRINAMETRQGGYDLLQGREIISILAETKLIDFVDVDFGHGWGSPSHVPSSYCDPGQFRDLAKAVKVDIAPIPVLFSGRVNEPTVAEQLLEGGFADLVGMARATIADPDFPTKVREGRMVEMRRCIACNRCIGEVIHRMQPAVCSVNPVVGNELLWNEKFRPAARPKRVIVVGGGAAGMETARIAAMRGHQVTVFEREETIGGQVVIASKAPGRSAFEDFVYYQENQAKALGVDVRLGAAASAEDVLALQPDVVVCATGSMPITPDVPGVDQEHVVQGWDVLLGRAKTGQRVAVIGAEDHHETINVADYLATQGKQVAVFHKWNSLGAEVDRYTLGTMLKRLEEGNVEVHYGLRLTKVDGSRLEFVSAYSGVSRIFEGYDSVALVYGSAPNARLHQELKGKVNELFLVGSAWLPRQIHEATQDGMRVALEL